MANMSYCRMHNTHYDLLDAIEHFDECASQEEKKFALRIIRNCQEVAKRFSDDETDEEILEELGVEDEEESDE